MKDLFIIVEQYFTKNKIFNLLTQEDLDKLKKDTYILLGQASSEARMDNIIKSLENKLEKHEEYLIYYQKQVDNNNPIDIDLEYYKNIGYKLKIFLNEIYKNKYN